MAWDLAFKWQRKMRNIRLNVTRYDRPEKLSLAGQSEMFDLTLDYTIIALARSKSRLMVEFEVKPRNIRARLFLQTAKLGKAGLQREFERKIVNFYGLDAKAPPDGISLFGAQGAGGMHGLSRPNLHS
ncbi:hypothetical protein [Paracoccus pacificus]|uniref:Uncharacterized protein n=1 Tax=Paracoccus pacificus TaxID=1463598 RepID=A0ABW4RB20_9RHOB